VVGYANAQPDLQIVQPANGSSRGRVNYVLNAAETQFAKLEGVADEYWPKPSLIVEREECWLVEFARKEPIYSFLGIRHAYRPTDRAMYMSIRKADNTLRYGRWCE
jgi:hypothetical protein